MDWEALKTLGAVAGPLVAIVSLLFNVYQFRQNTALQREARNTTAPAIRSDEIRASLGNLITKIDSSQIITIQPHYEHWLFGFPSLEEMRSLCAATNTIVSHSKIPPDYVKLIIPEMLNKINTVLYYRDSLDQLRRGREYLNFSDYEQWAHKRDAENALHDLQQYVRSRETQLRDYLRQLN